MSNIQRHSRVGVVATTFLVVITLSVAACGNAARTSVITTTTASATTSTTGFTDPSEIVTVETFPTSGKSATSRIECPTQEISKETTEPFGDILRCTTGWAVGIPQRIAATFNGDTDAEAEWVLAKTSSGWKVVGICHIYYPINPTGSTCAPAYDDTSVKIALLPPMPVQCTLWSAASWSEFVKETGCQSSE